MKTRTIYRKLPSLPSEEQVINQLTKDELVSNLLNILGIHEAQNEPTVNDSTSAYTLDEYIENLHDVIQEQADKIVKYQNNIMYLNEDIQEYDESIEELEWEVSEQKNIIKRLEEKLNSQRDEINKISNSNKNLLHLLKVARMNYSNLWCEKYNLEKELDKF